MVTKISGMSVPISFKSLLFTFSLSRKPAGVPIHWLSSTATSHATVLSKHDPASEYPKHATFTATTAASRHKCNWSAIHVLFYLCACQSRYGRPSDTADFPHGPSTATNCADVINGLKPERNRNWKKKIFVCAVCDLRIIDFKVIYANLYIY